MGKTRRFSPAFLREEREKLRDYRDRMRQFRDGKVVKWLPVVLRLFLGFVT
jgi:hypothetical protein